MATANLRVCPPLDDDPAVISFMAELDAFVKTQSSGASVGFTENGEVVVYHPSRARLGNLQEMLATKYSLKGIVFEHREDRTAAIIEQPGIGRMLDDLQHDVDSLKKQLLDFKMEIDAQFKSLRDMITSAL